MISRNSNARNLIFGTFRFPFPGQENTELLSLLKCEIRLAFSNNFSQYDDQVYKEKSIFKTKFHHQEKEKRS